MNYIEKVKEELRKIIDIEDEFLDLYTLLVFTVGVACTQKDIHDAWSVWANREEPDHRALKSFGELSKETQELDEPYRRAVVDVAERFNLN